MILSEDHPQREATRLGRVICKGDGRVHTAMDGKIEAYHHPPLNCDLFHGGITTTHRYTPTQLWYSEIDRLATTTRVSGCHEYRDISRKIYRLYGLAVITLNDGNSTGVRQRKILICKV